MISLQSHNQVLFHLTQLTAAFTPRSTNYSTRIKKNFASASTNHENLCSESLAEAAKNCTELSLENVDIYRLSVRRRIAKKRIRNIFNDLNAINHLSRPIDDHNKWKVSYVSGENFNENKRGYLSSTSISPIIFTSLGFTTDNIHRTNTNFHISTSPRDILVRGFKTDRNIEAESNRNPKLFERIRMWMGVSKHGGETPKLIERSDFEALKNTLNAPGLTGDEQQRVKVAFAEGYIAGNYKQLPGRGFKWLKLTQQIIFTVLGFIILISIVASTNGSVFRLQLGKRSTVDPEDIHVTFDDVKGVNEAKEELKEIVEFLKNPEKFSALGGRLPKGVLLVGPPGTGKTLLARAVAGEARVPFFHAAGAEFDEILVGQGARRVRDLFKAAKDRAPCVIFIDEIDSVGGKRTQSVIHPYANQTINQLLSEMDGFHQNEGVIVLGATNRRDDLDQALRRPGRFDIEVYVHKPDYKGRKEILELYLSKVLAKSLDIDVLARSTTGFTGADIETMVNQAALRAAIDGAEYVTMEHLERAREKVVLGPELKGRMPDGEENRITAYHEAGHALVGYYTKESHSLCKVTIIPRASSLGHTSFMPEKDVYHETKAKLLARMDMSLGGRAAEELIFGPDKVTTGAYSDLQEATRIAEAMVKNYGMSEKVGFRTETRSSGDESGTEYSPSTTELIDGEVKRLLQESYDRAKNILKVHAKDHKILAEALLKYETLDVEDIKTILSGKTTEIINDKRPPIIDVPANVM